MKGIKIKPTINDESIIDVTYQVGCKTQKWDRLPYLLPSGWNCRQELINCQPTWQDQNVIYFGPSISKNIALINIKKMHEFYRRDGLIVSFNVQHRS